MSFKALDKALGEAAAANIVPGFVAMATFGDGREYLRAFGQRSAADPAPMMADTLFWIASFTKLVTTVAALQLVDEGRLDLDRTVASILPDFADLPILEGHDADGKAIVRAATDAPTVRHLLTHTSGLGYTFMDADLAKYAEDNGIGPAEARKLPRRFEAGARWHYGVGIDWAGAVIEAITGKGLDAVSSADLAGITFAPVALNRVDGTDRLEMAATGITSTLEPASDYTARVTLKDGRQLRAPASVTPPRPQVDLLSKGEQHTESDTPSPVQLGSTDDLPLQARLVFFLRSRVPAAFPRKERIELAAVDGSFETTLSLADGSLMLEDAHTAVAVIDPLARFGASAFGPLQLRAVSADGVTGDWVQLGSLVRVPGFPVSSALHCPRNPARPCSLTGTNLFLISELSTAEDMNNAVDVAPDFTGNALPVPNEFRSGATATLYLRLRDDPKAVQVLTLPVLASQSSAGSGGSSATPNLSPAEPIGPPAPAAAPPSVR